MLEALNRDTARVDSMFLVAEGGIALLALPAVARLQASPLK